VTPIHEGFFLDENLSVKDASGQVQSGVGILLQHEPRFGIYVASFTPNCPADECGEIKTEDLLLTVEGYTIQPSDSLANVQRLVLGSSFQRYSTSQQKAEQYSIDLVRAAVSANNDLRTLRNLLAEAQQEIRRLRQDKQSLVEQTCLLARAQRTIEVAELDALKLELQQLKQTCEEQKAFLVRAKLMCVYICFFCSAQVIQSGKH